MKEKINHHGKSVSKGRVIAIVFILIIAISILIYFFLKNDYKNLEFGNNMSNKSLEEIEEYILNISSYEAKVEVTVESNKNKNQYVLNQKYTAPNISKQTVLEPSNIEGIETIYDGNTLTINHTKLNTKTLYENYSGILDNFLWLNSFIEDYKTGKNSNGTKLEEKDGNIIMETKVRNDNNQYVYHKMLYVDRKTGKPTKLFVQDINKKNLVYIVYSEITINGLQREEVLAFKQNVCYQLF